jgi:hypothetical protein
MGSEDTNWRDAIDVDTNQSDDRPAGSNFFDWLGDTQPFTSSDGLVPAQFVLEQVGDETFKIQQPFFYLPEGAREPIEISDSTLPDTDFASIPFYLSWFVSRHGRHTPAVLLHDMMITSKTLPAERVEADRLLRDVLKACYVPPVRTHVMWSGACLATRCTMGAVGIAGVVLWALAALAGTGAFVSGIASTNLWLVLAGAIGPFIGAVFWGRQYWAGVIGGYGLWLIGLPAIASLLGYGAYWVAEQAVRLVRRLLPSNKAKPLPGPPSYKAA